MHRSPAARVLICAVVLAALSTGQAPEVAADVNGVPICTAAGDELSPVIVSDGAGGAIVAWHDNRPTAAAGGVCYAQRVDAAGASQWTADGVALSTTGDPGLPVIVSDGSGGAFVAYAGNGSAPRVQWVSGAGVPQWGADGALLSVTTTAARNLAITRDVNGAGGIIVAWRQDNGTGGSSDIYAQKVNSAGVIQWSGAGAAIATTTDNETLPALVSDGAGGAMIAWVTSAGGVRVQRFNSSGAAQWSRVPLSTMANN